MIVKGTIWFTTGSQTVGIVYGQDEFTAERKAYIKKVIGEDEQEDIEDICNRGCRILPIEVKELNDFFQEGKV